ncbi:MAG: hypothetical protein ACPGQL_07645 [Thermoplasmatota archaeon]
MNTRNLTTMLVALLWLATPIANAEEGHDHHDAEGTSVGLLWILEIQDDDGEHITVYALDANGVFDNGVLVEHDDHADDSGVQLHDGCLIPGFDADEDLLEPYMATLPAGTEEPYYPYASYLIAQPDPAGDDDVGFADAGAIEAATWFWAQHGVDMFDHGALHDGCEALGGAFEHADVILSQDGHSH